MPTSPLTVRPLTPEEFPTAHRLLMLVFGESADDADRESELSVFELDRSLGTFDGDQLVGCMGAYSFDMSVPGGALPVAGTTWVGVSPTHRRRGILAEMMRRHFADVLDRREPLAALWASEAGIYGRFGYGVAVERLKCTVEFEGALQWESTAPPAATAVRFVPVEEARSVLDPIYEACRRRRPGMHARNEAWWNLQALSTRSSAREGTPLKLVAVAEVDGRDAAYAIYGLAPSFSELGRPKGTLKLIEMAGVDPAAEAAMWRYLLSHDLTTRVVARGRPVDELLPLLLTDPRRVGRNLTDALHLRVMDVARALRGRAYGESAGCTVEISDELVEANDGTWRVEVAPEGASIEPAGHGAPDLRMGIRALGSLYMGGISLRRLVAAGVVEAVNPSVVGAVDAAFASDEAGWIPEVW